MSALLLVRQTLSDIVKQARTLGGFYVESHFGRHAPGEQRHFPGVLELVLAVGGPETSAVQEPLRFPS